MSEFSLPADFESSLKNPEDLIPAIVQDFQSGEVLMLAWMNRQSISATIATGKATYWSRSRKELWEKGATSGNVQFVKSLTLDCDGDSLLLKVEQIGPACHTGERSCFHNPIGVQTQ
ncbi:MAG: phosphoribosyl-AMP cyclohydrolase [Actinomycetota bacterium]